MFVDVIFRIAGRLLVGGVIGFVVVALAYWRFPRRRRLLRGAIFGGLGFLMARAFTAWASSGTYYINDVRMNVTPLRGFVAEESDWIIVASTFGAALLAGARERRGVRPT